MSSAIMLLLFRELVGQASRLPTTRAARHHFTPSLRLSDQLLEANQFADRGAASQLLRHPSGNDGRKTSGGSSCHNHDDGVGRAKLAHSAIRRGPFGSPPSRRWQQTRPRLLAHDGLVKVVANVALGPSLARDRMSMLGTQHQDGVGHQWILAVIIDAASHSDADCLYQPFGSVAG